MPDPPLQILHSNCRTDEIFHQRHTLNHTLKLPESIVFWGIVCWCEIYKKSLPPVYDYFTFFVLSIILLPHGFIFCRWMRCTIHFLKNIWVPFEIHRLTFNWKISRGFVKIWLYIWMSYKIRWMEGKRYSSVCFYSNSASLEYTKSYTHHQAVK